MQKYNLLPYRRRGSPARRGSSTPRGSSQAPIRGMKPSHLISSQIAGLSRVSMFNSHQILEGVACIVPRRSPESRL
jgi:hypothetical protein